MEIDWDIVKKVTLWTYEDLIKKVLTVLSYKFVQDHYRHDMREAGVYAKQLLGYDEKYDEYVGKMTNVFKKLDSLGVANYAGLVYKVETREV